MDDINFCPDCGEPRQVCLSYGTCPLGKQAKENEAKNPASVFSENGKSPDSDEWYTDWYFDLWGRIHGPFGSKEEAEQAQSGMIADYYQSEM